MLCFGVVPPIELQVREPRPRDLNAAIAKAPGRATERYTRENRRAASIELYHTEVDSAPPVVDSSNQARPWGGVTFSGLQDFRRM